MLDWTVVGLVLAQTQIAPQPVVPPAETAPPPPVVATVAADVRAVEARVFYEEGIRCMAEGRYHDAVMTFDRLIARYPETQYARLAGPKREEAIALSMAAKSRRGFFIGFGLGAGHLFSDELEDNNFDLSGLAIDLRIGGGLNERFLLMGEMIGLALPQNSEETLNTYHLVIAGQLFLIQGLFFRLGLGTSHLVLDTRFGEVRSDSGFALIAVPGYEFRFGARFALSIEAGFFYAYLDQDHLLTGEGHMGFSWYF